MKLVQLKRGHRACRAPGDHVLAVGQAELGVLLGVLGHQEAAVLLGPQPGLRTPVREAAAARPFRREQVAGAVAGQQVVDILETEAAQRDRNQLGPLALGPPGPTPAVEQRLAEAKADVVQPELILAGLIHQRDLLDDLARRGQRDPVLEPDPGRAAGAEVPARRGGTTWPRSPRGARSTSRVGGPGGRRPGRRESPSWSRRSPSGGSSSSRRRRRGRKRGARARTGRAAHHSRPVASSAGW